MRSVNAPGTRSETRPFPQPPPSPAGRPPPRHAQTHLSALGRKMNGWMPVTVDKKAGDGICGMWCGTPVLPVLSEVEVSEAEVSEAEVAVCDHN